MGSTFNQAPDSFALEASKRAWALGSDTSKRRLSAVACEHLATPAWLVLAERQTIQQLQLQEAVGINLSLGQISEEECQEFKL